MIRDPASGGARSGPPRLAIAVVVVGVAVAAFVVVNALEGGPEADGYRPLLAVAAGDIADPARLEAAEATAELLDGRDLILTLGDHAYPDGTTANYAGSYNGTWGQFKTLTRPAPGNHDYHVEGAAGYFGYFGDAAGSGTGYYAFEREGWTFLSLDSNCDEVDCARSGPQVSWLRDTLSEGETRCQLAYFHHPLISIGRYRSTPEVAAFWQEFSAASVDVVLNGHDHNYQRWAPMLADGTPSNDGVQQFIVGTGGASSYPIERDDPRVETSFVGIGVLELDLYPASYAWRFRTIEGDVVDEGRRACR